jgi:hypothetical protein
VTGGRGFLSNISALRCGMLLFKVWSKRGTSCLTLFFFRFPFSCPTFSVPSLLSFLRAGSIVVLRAPFVFFSFCI